MIQLQYSSGSEIQNRTVYVDTKYTGSLLKIYLTSSFSGDVTPVDATIISNNSTDYGGWILYEIQSSTVPTKSGQYDANIYELETSGSATWITAKSTWINETSDWESYSADTEVGSLLNSDRALVSGSDYDQIFKHQFEDQANFNVYHG